MTEEKSALQRAKAYTPTLGRRGGYAGIPAEQAIELAMAWLKDEIQQIQLIAAVWPDCEDPRKKTQQSYLFVAMAIRDAYRRGLLKE